METVLDVRPAPTVSQSNMTMVDISFHGLSYGLAFNE